MTDTNPEMTAAEIAEAKRELANYRNMTKPGSNFSLEFSDSYAASLMGPYEKALATIEANAKLRADNAAMREAVMGFVADCIRKSKLALDSSTAESDRIAFSNQAVAVTAVHQGIETIFSSPNPGQQLLDELEKLRGIVGKLPKTADGVPIVPGMTVYEQRASGCKEMKNFMTTMPDEDGFSEFKWDTGWSLFGRLDRIYAKPEGMYTAALASQPPAQTAEKEGTVKP